MRHIILLLIFFAQLAPSFVLAQNNKIQARIDSLQKVVETTSEDTTKARSLCSLCFNLTQTAQMDSALEKGESGLQLARAAGCKKTEARCLFSIGLFYQKQSDYARALEYYQSSLKIHKEERNLTGAANALNNIGNIYYSQGDYALALDYNQKSLKIKKEIGDRSEAATALGSIGNIYFMQGDYARALEYYQNSLKILEEIGNRSDAAGTLANIGGIYWTKGDYARARDYFLQSMKINETTGNRFGVAKSLLNVGLIYSEQGNYARALDYFLQSLKIDREIGNRSGAALSLGIIGSVYYKQVDYVRALDYYQQALKIQEEIGEQAQETQSLAMIATIKIMMNQAADARGLAARALNLATEIGAMEMMQSAAEVRAQADSALGDWKSAYEHYKLYKQYSDSLNNESQSKEIGRLEAQYEFDKEIEERERREAEEAERRQMLYWIAAGVFAALLLVAGLLTWGFRTKQKANKLLAAQNAEIIQQSEEISQQRDELHAMNAQITEQRDVLEKAHEEITDSIDYASRIQHALLPSVDAMRQSADVFIYYKARDVVSGDFYWTHQIDKDTALYSAADCTGHGVPGAFMSVLGATTLDTIVRDYGETRPDKMLKLLDQNIRASLKQDENADGSLDGMDLALIKLDKTQNKLYFSSAGRPLFLLRKGEIIEYKGAKFPAGGAQHGEKDFPLIEIDLEPGDRIFMCSDGVTDQFGGPRGRKFSPRRLKETLLAHQDKNLQAQGAAFAEVFDNWQKNAKQLDDQLLIGLGV